MQHAICRDEHTVRSVDPGLHTKGARLAPFGKIIPRVESSMTTRTANSSSKSRNTFTASERKFDCPLDFTGTPFQVVRMAGTSENSLR